MSRYLKHIFLSYSIIFSKELYNSNQNVNDENVKHINDVLIELKKDINRKKSWKGKSKKIIDTVKKILNFNKQQNGRSHLWT